MRRTDSRASGTCKEAHAQPRRSGFCIGHHLHRHVADLGEEAVEHRAAQENIPARAGRLAEDHVGDALLLGKADQRVGDVAVGER